MKLKTEKKFIFTSTVILNYMNAFKIHVLHNETCHIHDQCKTYERKGHFRLIDQIIL